MNKELGREEERVLKSEEEIFNVQYSIFIQFYMD
jgi:hypothetical protein